MIKKILKIVAGLMVTFVVALLAIFIATGPQRPASDSSSAQWLEAGPHSIGEQSFVFVDSSRPTDENRGVPGKPDRTLNTTIWYPQDLTGSLPLIVHSHGIVSERTELAYLAEALASYGYIVVAADYPLTSGATEGGANGNDVVNQPADISFLIDSVLALSDAEKPFEAEIDIDRIGLTGFSLGGLTTYLTTYHPSLREPRVAAAVAIAGPSAAFAPQFFNSSNVPLLAIAGTADALIEHRRNAADIPQRASNASLVTIDGGSHLGFTGIAEPMLRYMDNPDTLGCGAVMAVLDEDPTEVFTLLGGTAQGVDMNRDLPGICDYGYPETTHPGRQQMITQIATLSFFESVFNEDSARRSEAKTQLESNLSADFTEATFSN